ncbi:asparaginase [Nostocoides sp. F2B08]|uniref:asparaginase n=1 Tax=Nostocoides sp. F2B08 TaxID=2653936 RepID=UPI001263B97B|nr:asparaginase [Tetrasphaera sp. F2B08]KAB7745088.1 asparaginase [Tetrasphaera sp. F2B08]
MTAPPHAPDETAGTPGTVLTDAPILAHYVRDGFVESVHRASLVAIDGSGEVLIRHGGIDSPTFPRSSLKPLQAVAMVRAGLALSPDLLALVCASHSGEPFHLEGVRRILAGAGLTVDALQNTPGMPIDDREHDRWIREGRPASSLGQNCSGKHAGMLATCVTAGWDPATYLERDHPLQRAVAETVADLAGETPAAVATDGCGAPVLAISLTGLARAFSRIASAPADTPEGTVASAIRSEPRFLGGTGRDVTTLIEGTSGLIAKDGAEGVFAVGLDDGRGVALKLAEGGGGVGGGPQRARPVIMAAALRRLAVASTAYEIVEDVPVLGHGKPVGAVVAVGV